MFSQANPTPPILILPIVELEFSLKHKCGTHFSSGPVDVGVTTTVNGGLAYICEKCAAKREAEKAQEAADLEIQFAERWVA